jgi:DNA-binding protein HU-beta
MTKSEVVNEISERTGVEKAVVQETVESFFKIVKGSLVNGENVYFRGFGSFVVQRRAQYTFLLNHCLISILCEL